MKFPKFSKDGITYVKTKTGDKVFVPKSAYFELLHSLHDENGHQGLTRTLASLSKDYYFPGWAKFVKNYIASCRNCQFNEPLNRKTLGKLNPIVTPEKPNLIWAMDTVVVGRDNKDTAAKYVQVIVDHHSRYVFAKATRKNTSENAIAALKQAIEEGGAPEKLITDNATNFKSNEFRSFARKHGIMLLNVAPFNPMANGVAKRLMERFSGS